MNNSCDLSGSEMNSPYFHLMQALQEVKTKCRRSMPVSEVETIADKFEARPEELLLHKIEGWQGTSP